MESQNERKFTGIWIPKEIWLDTELSMMEKIMLVEVDSLDNKDGCYASNGYFAEFFGISKSRVSQIISELSNKGFLSVDLKYKEGSKEVEKRVLRMTPLFRKLKGGVFRKLKGGIKFSKHPPLENCEDSNTVINNTDFNNTEKGNFKPNGLFSDSVNENSFEEKEPSKPNGKKNGKVNTQGGGSKWGEGVFSEAKRLFDAGYRNFNKKNGLHVGEREGVYWSVKEIGQLSQLMQMLKTKAEANEIHFTSNMDFVNNSLSVFIEKASNLTNTWYMGKFTPLNFVTHFEDIYIDVKKNITSGYIGRQKKTVEQVNATMFDQVPSLDLIRQWRENGEI